MGCGRSKPDNPPTEVRKLELTPEQEKLIADFQKKYPVFINVMNSSNNLSIEQATSYKNDMITKTKSNPTPSVEEFYTFMLSMLTKYNIKIIPNNVEVQTLMDNFATKYPYMQEYMNKFDTLTSDQKVEANQSVKKFTEKYPLGSVDEFHDLIMALLRKYNLPTPLEAFQTLEAFQDINYSKISQKHSLIEKTYASFSR